MHLRAIEMRMRTVLARVDGRPAHFKSDYLTLARDRRATYPNACAVANDRAV